MRMLSNEELALRWHEIQPLVQEALDHGIGESSSHNIFMECMATNAQCWEHQGLIGITRFIQYPQYKQLQVVVCSGENLWADGPECIEVFESFARDTGCRNVAVWGRKGWKRFLTNYIEPYTILVKEL